MKKRKKNSIHSHLIIIYISCTLVPILFLASILTYIFQYKNSQDQELQTTSLLYSIGNNIETYTDDLKRLSLSPHSYTDIMSFFTYVQNADYDNPEDPYKQYVITRDYTSTVQNLLLTARSDILGICYIPISHTYDNSLYVCSKYSGLTILNDYPYLQEDWYQEALHNNGDIIYTASSEVDYYGKKPVKTFSVVRRVRDVYTKKDIGIIKVDLTYDLLETLFKNMKCTNRSFVGLIDNKGNVIYENAPISDMLSQKALAGRTIKTDDDTYFLTYRKINETSWNLIYFSSQKDANGQIYKSCFIALIIFTITFIIAFCLFMMRSRRLTQSLQDILSGIEHVGSGDLDTSIETELLYSYELTKIGTQFNQMTKQLKLHIQNEYEAQLSQKVAEYKALQNQINPHFLYNTLNIFVTLNRLGYKNDLESGLIKLSNIFRYTCRNEENCTILQEFDFVRQYLEIQKLRYEERLNFIITCDYDIQDVVIPKLIVQPLVENAIKHGLEPSMDPITITVYAKKCTLNFEEPVNYAVIIISNDGIGFNPKEKSVASGIGLGNISERLNLFNKDSFFYIHSGEGILTVEYILIPLS